MSAKLRQLCWVFLLVPAAAAAAQYTLHGVVRDSLAGSVLAGASVHLVPAKSQWETGSSAIADSSGQYRITGIPGGRYLVGFVHPRLDSLGLDAVMLTIDVSGTDSELVRDLALPAAPTLVRSICGGLPANSGLLFGKVLRSDAGRPVSAGKLVAEWRELSLDKQPREWRTQSVVAQLADDGRFTLCGVPTDVAFRAHAEALGQAVDSTSRQNSPIAVSGTIDVEFSAGVPALHRDFIVSPVLAGAPRAAGIAVGTASVVGRVLDDAGRPVDRARVVLRASAAADSVAITDSTGRFRLDSLHGGTFSIEIDRIGMEPRRSAIDLLDGTSRRTDFSLRRVAQELAGVTVTARSSMEQAGFDYRRTHRNGFFRTADDIAREGAFATSFALKAAPMLMQWGSNLVGRPALAGPLQCKPLLFIDGTRVPMPALPDSRLRVQEPGRGGTIDPPFKLPADLDDILPVYRIGGVEVYAPGEAPARFADPFSRCSSIVIWSKGVVNAH